LKKYTKKDFLRKGKRIGQMEENSMQEILKKAEVLIEALPYIQRFNRKIIVVKYGGSAMVDEELKQSVIQDVTLLKLVGFKPIIVHGGGKEISKWVAKAGMEPEFINGLRKTDAPTMEIAVPIPRFVKISSNRQCAILPSKICTLDTPFSMASMQLFNFGSIPPPI
jgi:hypothetical protein